MALHFVDFLHFLLQIVDLVVHHFYLLQLLTDHLLLFIGGHSFQFELRELLAHGRVEVLGLPQSLLFLVGALDHLCDLFFLLRVLGQYVEVF